MEAGTVLLLAVVTALILGTLIGYGLYRIKNRHIWEMKKMAKDPQKLKAELEKQGKIIDMGQEVNFDIKEVKGQNKLSITRKPVEPRKSKKEPAKKKPEKKEEKKEKKPKKDSAKGSHDFYKKILKGGKHGKSRR